MAEDLFGSWRKSSYSGAESNCVEVAWRKSSYSGDESNCVEMAWRKTTYSADEANCVELASIGAVRDSKNPAGGMLRVDLPAFLAGITAHTMQNSLPSGSSIQK